MEDKVIVDRLSELCFRVYSEEEILKLSVKEITNPQLFDNLQLPTVCGLYDPDLGASRNDEVCTSCGLSGRHCPGHMGHIRLVLPVFNPVFFKTLLKILQGTCLSCHRLFMSRVEGLLFVHQMKLLEKGNVVGARTLQHFVWEYQAEKGGEGCFDELELIPEIERLAEQLMKDSSASLTQCTKMANSEMSLLVQSVLKQFFTTLKVCPHCRTETLVLRQEYFSRITAKGGRGKRVKVDAPTPKGKTPKAKTTPPQTEDQEQVEKEELEEVDEVDHLLAKGKGQCLIMPHLARQILRKLWKNDGKVLAVVFSCLEHISETKYPTDMFFLCALLVPPSRFRPLSVMGDRKFENPQTANLSRVLTDNYEIGLLLSQMHLDLNKSTDLTIEKEVDTSMEELQMKWIQLQTHVNCLIDSDLDKLTADNKKIPGIRQLLEKKEGLFRMHMMGKRVNYAARSVISPDPCINTNQIGVPDVFAKKLTYPQPVTPWNVHELRQYVINGPNIYPGASAVVSGDGSVTKLSPTSQTQREAVAKQLLTPCDTSGKHLLPKQVLRHLKDGDVLLLNRQPTLHRPSIQAHRARVLPGLKTLRLHYSNCKAYNADFDGDEMNAHFPQSELCRAEAYGIASTDFQYLVPKDGTPLAGLIQDHLVAGVALTVRGQFFNRDDYFNLLQSALTDKRGKLRLLPAAIVKPCQMWSGKQVISTLLLNIIPKDRVPLSMEGKAKIKEKSWIQRHTENEKPYMSLKTAQGITEDLGESTVVIDKGELLQGVLDKAHCGPSSFGLVHCVYELYGGEVAGKLLTCMGRLFTAFLKLRGFTLGIEDILVKDKAEKRRRKKMRKAPEEGHRAALEAFGMTGEDCSDADLLHLLKEAQFGKDDMAMKQLDNSAKKVTNEVSEKISLSIIGEHLYKSFPDNNLQLMVQSGAKGGSVNCIQISSMLGQIELEGRRPPLMSSGRSLPSFVPYDLSLKAGGFVTGRFLTGIRPQEYFFHCMAGREGLIDTAVKTSRSGYLQRCLVKHLEGLTVHYDMTVRDSDASVVQFLYGEDGLEVGKTPFLEKQQFPFLLRNQHVLATHQEQSKENKHVKKYKKKIDKWKKKNLEKKTRGSGFLDFCNTKGSELTSHQIKHHSKRDETDPKSPRTRALEVEWRNLKEEQRQKFMKKHFPCVDPVLSKFWPQQHAGVISENMQKSIQLIQQQLTELGEDSDERGREQSLVECQVLEKLVHNKVMKSLAQPGEAVGLLCAQSIGEPSTQMTLNTFHFAGRGEMNVTLGIPRLREILMTASANILTPCMEIPVLDVPGAQEEVEKLQKRLSCVYLSEVLQEVQINDFLHSSSPETSFRRDRKRMYRIHFTLLPKECYNDKLEMKPKEIVKHIEKELICRIARAASRLMDKRARERPADLVSQATERNVGRNDTEDIADDDNAQADDGDSDVEFGDGDSMATKAMARHTDTQEYEGEDEERKEVGDDMQLDDVDGSEERSADGELEQDAFDDDSDDDHDEAQEARDIETVKSFGCVHDYTRDKKGKWCEVVLQFNTAQFLIDMKSVVERESKRSVLQQVRGIKRCMLIKQANRFSGKMQPHLVTEGINLQEMMNYNHILDLNSLYTNNIHEIETTYGIEAANKAIIKEVQTVFKPYEIQVNPRHLSLLADYMTCEGTYKGFNRTAMNSNPSPLQKITFETSMTFLVNSCTHGRPDQLRSPSARIVAGQVVSSGTGSFEIVQPLNARTSRA